jgi:hypothetical protein
MFRALMRIAAVLSLIVLVAGSVAFAANGDRAARTPSLRRAVADTASSSSERYALHVRMTRDASPVSLHVHGQAAKTTISVSLRMGDTTMPDGTRIPGARSAALIDGPFLYEHAPSSVAVFGKVRWLRLRLSDLPKSSNDLRSVHALTPAPLLRLLGAAHMKRASHGSPSFHGTIAYDSPAVRTGLANLTGGLEFRGLRISANVGTDGLVHRIVVTGHTADRRTTFSLRAHLFGFGKPIHVTPPAPGTFLDPHNDPPA